ncbi:hypothetical protein [Streptomyces sp. NPDC085540]
MKLSTKTLRVGQPMEPVALPGNGEPPQLWLVHAQEEYDAAAARTDVLDE